ncbi:hypothetical protein EUX98_g3975 [Antrodiella citrinella]|uniref:IBR domain-containing protein n=1 Tax=Antrodiella citrinella TaxID=2447956 RepID=A0A4S4MV33_9APHY|nr:hypothetical protein EUX98_g3975 [Antrodiella citrinella]
MDTDVLSELLIAQLLEEDMRILSNQQEAETLQITQAIADSVRGKSRIPMRAARETTPDVDVALRIMAEEARLSGDAALAQSLQHSTDAEATANRQCAMRLAASDKKDLLDAEFARRLQEVDEEEEDMDAPHMKDAESVLGRDAIERIFAEDPNHKGKGKNKGRQLSFEEVQSGKRIKTETDIQVKQESGFADKQLPTCGICMETFHATYSPITATKSANSSSRLPFGIYLSCPQSHPYCLDCLTTYIKTKLDPNDDGSGNTNSVVFPIPCPECTLEQWEDGITDEIATRLLTEKVMTLWAQNWRRCPKCAVIVELAYGCNHITCRCGTHFCFKCGSLWDIKKARCTRVPSCELWDEEMLLAERERNRDARAGPQPARRVVQPAPPPPYAPAHYPVPHVMHGEGPLDWILDREFLCTRHPYTANMIANLTCLYCDVRLNSLADMQYHLVHTRRHPLYTCCGRFFKRAEDWNRHTEAAPRRWGFHQHSIAQD